MNFCYFFYVFLVCFCAVSGQRVAPGVPPQQYAVNPQPGMQHQQVQYQQVQYGQQQMPVQQMPQQQVNMQHMQQQVPQMQVPQMQQQVPVQMQVPVQHQQVQMGHHPQHGQPQQILNAANIAHEKQHIAEHLEVPIDTSKMSEQELQFHYFKMHDADNNNKLDGCELIKSLIHWHEQGSKDKHPHQQQQQVEEKVFKDDELITLIDPILNVDDVNQDGYIDYPEFIRAQQKAAGAAKPSA